MKLGVEENNNNTCQYLTYFSWLLCLHILPLHCPRRSQTILHTGDLHIVTVIKINGREKNVGGKKADDGGDDDTLKIHMNYSKLNHASMRAYAFKILEKKRMQFFIGCWATDRISDHKTYKEIWNIYLCSLDFQVSFIHTKQIFSECCFFLLQILV